MSVAALAIDNFLSDIQWSSIQSNISDYLDPSTYKDERDSLHELINVWIEECMDRGEDEVAFSLAGSVE